MNAYAIEKAQSEINRYLATREVPGSREKLCLKGGVYCVPLQSSPEIDVRLTELTAVYMGCCTRFCEVYEARRDEGREALRVLGQSVKYPSLDEVQKAYAVNVSYIPLGAASSIEGVSAELYAREKAKIEAQCAEAKNGMQSAVEEGFRGVVEKMVDMLTPAPDGSRKRFMSANLTAFKDFFAQMDELKECRIMDSTRIDSLVLAARNVLAGKPVEMLKKDDGAREQVVVKFREITASLSAMSIEAPSRAITLED